MMERQVQVMARLVDDLLDVSRITRGKIELRKEPVELRAVVARAVETARPLIEARGHDLTVDLPPETAARGGRPVRLAQVVANLLNNAAKYTEPGGRIRLTAGAARAAKIVLRVRDTGIGIAPDMLPHVFDLFVQARPPVEPVAGRAGHRPDAGAAAGGDARRPGRGPQRRARARAANSWCASRPPTRRRRRAGTAAERPAAAAAGRRSSWWTTTPTRRTAWRSCCGCGGTRSGPLTAGRRRWPSAAGFRPGRGLARHRHAGHERLRGGPAVARPGRAERDGVRRPDGLRPGRRPAALGGGRLPRPSGQAGRSRSAAASCWRN